VSRRASTREMKAVADWVRDQGCEVELSNGHYRVTYNGRLVGAIASSPSDPRAYLNAKSFIKKNLAKIKEAATNE
jgi:hypothetical protein